MIFVLTFLLSTLSYSAFSIPVKFEKEWGKDHSGYIKPAKLVIYSEKDWEDVWREVHKKEINPQPAPKIDFEKYMILAVFMGDCPLGGYHITITNIYDTGKEILAEVKEVRPTHGLTWVTAPYHMIMIKKSHLPVRFISQ
jgi:hypothetical protein